MVSEEEVIRFLMEHDGEATLDEIASSLGIRKYGLNSAYALLYSLKSKNIVERRGNKWALVKRERGDLEIYQKPVEEVVKKVAENLREFSPKSSEIDLKIEKEKHEAPADLAFIKPSKSYEAIRTLKALQTGTILDGLFLGLDGDPLDGIPLSGQIMIAGPLGAGKSLIVGEVALKIADSGKKALYVAPNGVWSARSQRFDLQSRMRIRAENLNLSWHRICENLYVFDQQLMKGDFIEEYKRLITSEEIVLTAFDSLNDFRSQVNEARVFHEILENIIRVNRAYNVTGLFTVHLNPEKFGLIDTSETSNFSQYLMDGEIAVTNVQIDAQGLRVNIRGAEKLRVIKVLWCRLCGFIDEGLLIRITHDGLIQSFESILSEY